MPITLKDVVLFIVAGSIIGVPIFFTIRMVVKPIHPNKKSKDKEEVEIRDREPYG